MEWCDFVKCEKKEEKYARMIHVDGRGECYACNLQRRIDLVGSIPLL